MERRRPYTTAGVMTRVVERDGVPQTDVTTWNGTAFADSDEMARMLTLGAMLTEFPPKDGWQNHTAFVRAIDDDLLREWGLKP